MPSRKLFIVVSCLTVLGLFMASCAPAAPAVFSPTSVSAPTAKPAAGTSVPAAATATTKPPTEGPRYGGILTRAMNRDLASFDVQREQGADASVTLFNVYQGLVRLNPIDHQKIVPELAQSWEVSPDGKVYTFKFYKDIKWHDGKPFTMEDVKYSLDRMHDPKTFKTVSPRGEGLLVAMDSAEIVNEDTVKITVKYPSASFLLNLASGWVAIEPKHILTDKGDMRRDCVGTGPFKLKEFNPNISLELTKNANYYIKGLPYLDGIQFYTIKDGSTRFAAFRAGKVKRTFVSSTGLSSTEAEILKREMPDKIAVYEHDSLTRTSINFNMHRKPWDDVRVRKAVDIAFDRQAGIKINGRGQIGSIYVAPWGMKPEELAKLPGYRQPKDPDIAEAKRLLAEAGFLAGFKTTLLNRTGAVNEASGVFDKDQLAKIGIDAELVVLENAPAYERFERRAFDLFEIRWTDNTGDPDETLFTYYRTGGSRNYGGFSNEGIDQLIDKQARTLDVKAREAILAEIERKVMEQVPMVIGFWDVWQTGAWKEVKNFSPGPGIHP